MCVGLESGWGPGGGAVPVPRESERRRDGTYRTVHALLCKVKRKAPYGKAYGKAVHIHTHTHTVPTKRRLPFMLLPLLR